MERKYGLRSFCFLEFIEVLKPNLLKKFSLDVFNEGLFNLCGTDECVFNHFIQILFFSVWL